MTGCAALAAGAALAQRVEVRKRGEGRLTVGLNGLIRDGSAEARMLYTVLKADLQRSGYFQIVSVSAAFEVVGRVSSKNGMRAEVQLVQTTSPGRQLLGRVFSAPEHAVRRLAHRMTDALVMAATGRPGMASAKLAMVGNRTGSKELYVCDIDGKNLRQITNDRSIVVAPCWTPDGKNITYTSYKYGYPNVCMTGRRQPLASYGGLNTSGVVSPAGHHMAVILSKDGNPELYIKDMSTGALQRLTSTRHGNEASPCWSPDGSRLAYVSDISGRPQIYVASLNGAPPQRVSRSASESTNPDWGLNGRLAYCSRQGGRYRIVVANLQERTVQVLPGDDADYEDPSWAPDGRHIVCSRMDGYRSAIYLLDTLEDRPIALKKDSGDWFSPACSPLNL